MRLTRNFTSATLGADSSRMTYSEWWTKPDINQHFLASKIALKKFKDKLKSFPVK